MNNIEKLIFSMIDDLDAFNRDKDTLMPMYVEQRLNKCLQSYQHEVLQSISNLSYKQYRKALKEELDKYD